MLFAQEMLAVEGEDLGHKTCLISGSGNVAQFTAEKLIQFGARPVTMSDSSGFIHDPDGIDSEKLAWVKALKNQRRGRIAEYSDRYPRSTHHPAVPGGRNPMWAISADCAFPSATQNEIAETDADALVADGVRAVIEGANMPTTPTAIDRLLSAGVLFGPSKAANAGGVAVSALEMAQDIQLLPLARVEVENRLASIMRHIHDTVRQTAEEYGSPGNYCRGANIAGFVKVADAMLDESPV